MIAAAVFGEQMANDGFPTDRVNALIDEKLAGHVSRFEFASGDGSLRAIDGLVHPQATQVASRLGHPTFDALAPGRRAATRATPRFASSRSPTSCTGSSVRRWQLRAVLIEWDNIATVVGQQYDVSWSAFNGSLVYSAGGTPTDDIFTFQPTGGSLVPYDLAPGTGGSFTYSFSATSPLTTITFKDNTGFDSNAGWIDNVTMVLVPEPGMLRLAGLAAALFAGRFGLRRRANWHTIASSSRLRSPSPRPKHGRGRDLCPFLGS